MCHLDAEMTKQGLDGLDLENIDFTNIKNITITSAASTPDEDVIDILNFLNK